MTGSICFPHFLQRVIRSMELSLIFALTQVGGIGSICIGPAAQFSAPLTPGVRRFSPAKTGCGWAGGERVQQKPSSGYDFAFDN
jgi:hypothetical protein